MGHSRTAGRRAAVAAIIAWGWSAAVPAQGPPAPRPRWVDKAPIRVWVDPERVPAGGKDLVGRAVRTWSDAAMGRLDLRPTSIESDAGIRVHFVDARARYGETAPHLDARGRILSADIAITAPLEGDPLDRSIVVYLTALHELGHALGLAHTDRFDDIMYAFRLPGDGERYFGRFRRRVAGAADIGSARATGLSAADVQALRALYGR